MTSSFPAMETLVPSLAHAFGEVLTHHAQRACFEFQDHAVSYAQTVAYVEILAQALRNASVSRGDVIASMFPPRPEALITLLAAAQVGATVVGLNPKLSRFELQQIIDDTQPKVLVGGGGHGVAAEVTSLAEASCLPHVTFGATFWTCNLEPSATDGGQFLAALSLLDTRAPAVIIHTSGSTGKPKGALISHRGLAFRAATMASDRFDSPPMRQIVDLPVNHIGALASGIGLSLMVGGTLYFSEKFDPRWTLALVARKQIDMLSGVPAMLSALISLPEFASADLSSIRYVSWGAGPLPESVLDALLMRTTALFSQQYGMTETNGPVSYTPPTRDKEVLLHTTGYPDRRLEFRVQRNSDSAEGEILVRQPEPFLGYLNEPLASRDVFTEDGYLHTGDVGYFRDDGYLVLCGRIKEMFKSGGYNVYPREVEQVLESHSKVRAACVLGVPSERWGETGHAFVELSSDIESDALIAWCSQHLANYKVPKALTIVSALPRTSVGKVDRMALLKNIKATAESLRTSV